MVQASTPPKAEEEAQPTDTARSPEEASRTKPSVATRAFLRPLRGREIVRSDPWAALRLRHGYARFAPSGLGPGREAPLPGVVLGRRFEAWEDLVQFGEHLCLQLDLKGTKRLV